MAPHIHHAIIVTSYGDIIDRVHTKAVEIFGEMVTPISKGTVNRARSFMVGPDGGKADWDSSRAGDALREQFKAWLRAEEFDEWVEVQYGDIKPRIVDSPSALARIVTAFGNGSR